MTLEDLGYTDDLEKQRQGLHPGSFGIGRVTQEHKDRYTISTESHELEGELIGNLRFSASSRNDFPAVGDWVAISEYDEGKALIHAILPRYSVLERQAVGKFGEKQIIACNIDYSIIVQSVNRDFSLNRLERYLTICHAAHISPIIVISKIDLAEKHEVKTLLEKLNHRIKAVPFIPLSNETHDGIEELKKYLYKGKTYCLLGSSGVGKSSLINSLSGESKMKIGEISDSVNRGKHITTHRELIPMVQGAILIDNPGMREVGITESYGGLENTFEKIYKLVRQCKFSDCQHTTEIGCAVKTALEKGEIDAAAFENFLKMEREKEHYESTIVEKRKKDKDFGKMIKQIKKDRKSNKY
ncbi:ribosome small subunit-dependent GTPase A [Maribacter litopenaei]|uniref:Small ribosomal subunit biogenesis GTPase RsgA n=1 Tax=Maribacter litopenaei TaxID=2976127 RepID=A0ABY5Y5H6_9FLAO|nr:ribosome small subunit-dependent GTPase A [Maribacter litopenaei]UWX53730.1 ribosome small subunit-dependent GTPase A [Maribacter litopenaei]